jgi:hypothetical protein
MDTENDIEELPGEDDTQVIQTLRSSRSSWTRFQLCDFSPSASGVLRLMRRQDEAEKLTQQGLASTPWSRLDSQYGAREFRVDGNPTQRVFEIGAIGVWIEPPSMT